MESAPAEPTTQPQQHSLSAPQVGALLIGLITAPVLLLDQASKLFVRSHMMLYESIAIIHNWFDITYTLNPGAAFSLFVRR